GQGRGQAEEVERLFPPETDPFFRAERIHPRNATMLPAGFSILVAIGGAGTLAWGEKELGVRRGDSVLIPFGAGDCSLRGPVEAIRCLPPNPVAPDSSAPSFR
ncbi:MAG: hypothetical protein ACRDHB_04090, partial [Actinomycetota bacterium]